MDVTPSVLARLFLEAMIFGGILDLVTILIQMGNMILFGTSVSALRGKRIGISVLLAVEDVLFCLLIAVGILLLAFSGTNGVIRSVLPVGVLVGFFCTRHTVGIPIRKISAIPAAGIRRLVRFAIKILLWVICIPVKPICRAWTYFDLQRKQAVLRNRAQKEKKENKDKKVKKGGSTNAAAEP